MKLNQNCVIRSSHDAFIDFQKFAINGGDNFEKNQSKMNQFLKLVVEQYDYTYKKLLMNNGHTKTDEINQKPSPVPGSDSEHLRDMYVAINSQLEQV